MKTYFTSTRLDILLLVSVVNQHMQELKQRHLEDVLYILHYMRGVHEKYLLYTKYWQIKIELYFYAGDVVDLRSLSEYYTCFGENLVT